jgi:hypothetical protein
MDFYRSKGSERSYEIFFKSVFGVVPTFYYPKHDLFKLSDGKWYKPIYLEVQPRANNLQTLLKKQIVGSISGATAFVESIVRKRVNSKYIDVLYVSDVDGLFIIGDIITPIDDLIQQDYPIFQGSLTSAIVITGGENFNVGDLLTISSGSGKQGVVRVTEISSETGVVRFTIEESGFGFTNNALVIVSSKVFDVSGNSQNFKTFDTIIQPLAEFNFSTANSQSSAKSFNANTGVQNSNNVINITSATDFPVNSYIQYLVAAGNTEISGLTNGSSYFVSFANSTHIALSQTKGGANIDIIASTTSETGHTINLILQSGDIIESYTSSGIAGNGQIVSIIFNTSGSYASGVITVATNSGNIAAGDQVVSGQFYKQGNTITALSSSYTDESATGNVVGSNATSVGVANISNAFIADEYNYVINRGTRFRFNANTGVDNTNNTIYFGDGANTFSNGTLIRYVTAIGNTPISGLANNERYYIATSNNTHITLKIAAGTSANIDITASSINENGHFIFGPLFTSSIQEIGLGSGASFKIGALSNPELIRLSSTFIRDTSVYGIQYLDLIVDGTNANSSGGYGFPKSPGAGSNSVLLDCFDIENYTIGSVSTLVSINSGQEYTKPPFVKIYEPLVASYGRKDLILKIGGSTRPFANGELLEQTRQAAARVLTISTFTIDGLTFNANTNVDNSNDTINLTNAQSFSVNTQIRYIVSAGNTAISGLTNAGTYFVSFANDTHIALSGTRGGANINITASTTSETGHTISKFYTAPLAGEYIYQGTLGVSETANGIVYSSSISNTAGVYSGTITVVDFNGTFTTGVVKTATTLSNSNITSIASDTINLTAKGQVLANSNTSVIYLKLLTLNDIFGIGNNVTGADSGAEGTIIEIIENDDRLILGNNAIVSANVIVANATITSVAIEDSGYGYKHDEVVSAASADGQQEITIKLQIESQGEGKGFYQSDDGFASDNKYLHDGEYYQNYSYDIKSSVPFDNYKDILKQILHVAGTRMFGTYVSKNELDLIIDAESSIDEIET